MQVKVKVADKQTLDTVKTTTDNTKTMVDSVNNTIGTPQNSETVLSELKTIKENTEGGIDLTTVNSNMEKPLNVQLIEQTWAMGMTDESMNWGFRQDGYVGEALWFYGQLWKYAPAAMETICGLPTIDSIAASTIAMDALSASTIAMDALSASTIAQSAIRKSSMAIAKYACGLAGYDHRTIADMPALAQSSAGMSAVAASSVAMSAVAASSVAMSAVAASSVAMSAVSKSKIARDAIFAKSSALTTVQGSAMAIGKFAVGCADLNPDEYKDIAAVAAASAAMSAIAGSSTAMSAIAGSSTAMSAIAGSTVALDALYAKRKRMSGASKSLSGKFIILEISGNNAFDTSQYGYATLSDGSKPSWSNYKAKYTYFKQYKKYATFMKNDTDSDDWIDYFQI